MMESSIAIADTTYTAVEAESVVAFSSLQMTGLLRL